MICFESFFPEAHCHHAIMRTSAALTCQSVLSSRPELQVKGRQIYLQDTAHSNFEWFTVTKHVTMLCCKTLTAQV